MAIIASSASVFSFDRQKSREAGCDDFLPKAVQAGELLERLQEYLGLTWIYETEEQLISPSQVFAPDVAQIAIPPVEQLITLYQAAKRGYISEIQETASQLKQLDRKYTTFADKVSIPLG